MLPQFFVTEAPLASQLTDGNNKFLLTKPHTLDNQKIAIFATEENRLRWYSKWELHVSTKNKKNKKQNICIYTVKKTKKQKICIYTVFYT